MESLAGKKLVQMNRTQIVTKDVIKSRWRQDREKKMLEEETKRGGEEETDRGGGDGERQGVQFINLRSSLSPD